MNKRSWIVIAVIAIGIIGIFLIFRSCKKEEVVFNTAVVQKKTVEMTITATGYVQPVDKVDIGTQVSGVIEKIHVDFNSQVKKGELLAELDKSSLIERVTQAEASLVSAQSELTYAQQNFDRTKQLFEVKAATQAAFEQATNSLAQSKTSLANAKANLHQARVNLGYAEIYSPIDGVVLNKAVEQGQTVAASFSTPTLFTIARDLKKMQVEANVDEADIGQVKMGQKVTFTVDSYSDDVFVGTVNQIRLQPVITSNVVTYTVIIEAPNPDEKLFPGMTASVTIITESQTGLGILTEALNFQPAEETSKKDDAVPEASNRKPKGRNGAAAEALEATNRKSRGRSVWVQTENGLEKRSIKTGLSDGVNIIVESGLQEGETVVLSIFQERKKQAQAAANPLMPQRGGGGQRR